MFSYKHTNDREQLRGDFFYKCFFHMKMRVEHIDLWTSKKFIIASLHSLPNDEWQDCYIGGIARPRID